MNLDYHFIEKKLIPALQGNISPDEKNVIIEQLKHFVKESKNKIQFKHSSLIPRLTFNYRKNEDINAIANNYLSRLNG